ncbi:tyrosine-type recombinase/integrase [Streptomyces sp. NPDC088147]|uniref:tyrosine-type recombinase/integrase n=1 Tax=unclassified Streptomyces TaxID=2593676 RepID=UPI0038105C7A
MPTASSYGHHFMKACKAAGLVDANGKPKCTPHGLRHFFASTALANGISLHEVSRWLGHKSIRTTVDIYVLTVLILCWLGSSKVLFSQVAAVLWTFGSNVKALQSR